MSAPGKILVITGSTGAGKSTTCAEFVAQQDELWLHFGVDLFFGKIVPRKFIDGGGSRSGDGLYTAPDDPANPDGPWHMALGPLGWPMMRTFHRMVAEASRSGQNVVVDHIAMVDPPILADCVRALKGLPVTFVALKPPPEVSPRRIDERLETIVASLGREHAVRNSENKKKVAKFLYERIFANEVFDLVVDSEANAPPEVARLIGEAIGDGWGKAFPELARRLEPGTASLA
jgi:chloramphenicol 3-O-phosphotransferase